MVLFGDVLLALVVVTHCDVWKFVVRKGNSMMRKGDEAFEEVGDGDKSEHEQGCVESTQQACLC